MAYRSQAAATEEEEAEVVHRRKYQQRAQVGKHLWQHIKTLQGCIRSYFLKVTDHLLQLKEIHGGNRQCSHCMTMVKKMQRIQSA